jgi:predicted DNA-binding transcriptional regulator AlpA
VADETDPLLNMDEVAALIGVRPMTMRTYHNRAKRARDDGYATEAHLPEPDRMWGRTPSWRRSTIERWRLARANRPNVIDVPPAED